MNLNTPPYLLFIIALSFFTYLLDTQLNFYLNDAGLYATLGKHIAQTNDWFSLLANEQDWLDKPHFPFWISAAFFKVFGINTFAYRLPLVLAIFASFVYTFKFADKYYNRTVAWYSVFVLATAQYSFMSATEGRVEPYLMLAIIGAIYHFDKFIQFKNYGQLIIGSLYVAIAIMTKGIFIFVPIFGAIGGHLIYRDRSLKGIFQWHWLLVAMLIALFILPEIYSLYVQFDSQPNKVVFGKTGVSGIKWFLWDSQFSRLINSGPFTRSKGDPFFFLHTMLWAFLPWCLVLYYGFVQYFRRMWKLKHINETYSFFGGGLIFVLFSISQFQLPHYMTIVFPFYAIIVANVFEKPLDKIGKKVVIIGQSFQIILACMLLLLFVLFFNTWPARNYAILLILTGFALTFLFTRKLEKTYKLFLASGLVITIINIYMSIYLYPAFSEFKADIKAANYVNEHFKGEKVKVIGYVSDRFDFYCKKPTKKYFTWEEYEEGEQSPPKFLLCTDAKLQQKLQQPYKILVTFPHYHGERISLELFDKGSQKKVLTEYSILVLE